MFFVDIQYIIYSKIFSIFIIYILYHSAVQVGASGRILSVHFITLSQEGVNCLPVPHQRVRAHYFLNSLTVLRDAIRLAFLRTHRGSLKCNTCANWAITHIVVRSLLTRSGWEDYWVSGQRLMCLMFYVNYCRRKAPLHN